MKYTKSICLSRDAWEVVEALQKRTKKSISYSIEILIFSWLRLQKEADLMKKQAETDAKNYLNDIKTATVEK